MDLVSGVLRTEPWFPVPVTQTSAWVTFGGPSQVCSHVALSSAVNWNED